MTTDIFCTRQLNAIGRQGQFLRLQDPALKVRSPGRQVNTYLNETGTSYA